MKVFISWSGNRSRAVAEALHDWLSRIIQAVEPFYTPYMEKGVKWSNEIDDALEGTRFGIVCLTPDNLHSDWIHFETGALSKTKDAVIWTFLHGLKAGDVPQPLGKFQHTVAEKADVLKLVHSINARLREIGTGALKDSLLDELFEETWAKFDTKLVEAEKKSEVENVESTLNEKRDEKDILNEILEVVRSQQRQINELDEKIDKLTPKTTPTRPHNSIREEDVSNILSEFYSKKKYFQISFSIMRDAEFSKTTDIDLRNYFYEILPEDELASIQEDDALFSVSIKFEGLRDRARVSELRAILIKKFADSLLNWRTYEIK